MRITRGFSAVSSRRASREEECNSGAIELAGRELTPDEVAAFVPGGRHEAAARCLVDRGCRTRNRALDGQSFRARAGVSAGSDTGGVPIRLRARRVPPGRGRGGRGAARYMGAWSSTRSWRPGTGDRSTAAFTCSTPTCRPSTEAAAGRRPTPTSCAPTPPPDGSWIRQLPARTSPCWAGTTARSSHRRSARLACIRRPGCRLHRPRTERRAPARDRAERPLRLGRRHPEPDGHGGDHRVVRG